MNRSVALGGIVAITFVLAAFTVPLAGPLRSSSAHVLVAAVILGVGVALAVGTLLPIGTGSDGDHGP